MEATWKPIDQPVGNQVVHLEPGQFVTGRFDLHGLYNNGMRKRDHASEYTVWRWLMTLESLELLSIKSSNKYSVVSIVNWGIYQAIEQNDEQQNEQDDEQDMSSKCATDEQQMSTNKNLKNLKNVKNLKDLSTEIQNFRSRYSSDLLVIIDSYFEFIASTRSSKRIADSVFEKVYKQFERYAPVRVEYAIRTHMSNPEYSKAKEEYTFGILRNSTDDEAERKLATMNAAGSQKRRTSFDRDTFLASLREEKTE
jgi:uncharacterized membrane protein